MIQEAKRDGVAAPVGDMGEDAIAKIPQSFGIVPIRKAITFPNGLTLDPDFCFPVERILNHPNPDNDTILSLFILYEWGEDRFPGVRKAIDKYQITASPERYQPLGYTPEKCLQEKTLLIDTGGLFLPQFGIIDHYPHAKDSRLKGYCASDLVAIICGVYEARPLQRLLKSISQVDLDGLPAQEKSDIFAQCHVDRTRALSPQRALKSFFATCRFAIEAQARFFEAEEEYLASSTLYRVSNGGEKLNLCVVEGSPNKNITRFARSPYASTRAHVTLQLEGLQGGGPVAISYTQDLVDVMCILRSYEMALRGEMPTQWFTPEGELAPIQTATDFFELLRYPGTPYPISPYWHGHPNLAGQIFMVANGSQKAEIPHTIIPPETTVALTRLALSDRMAPECPNEGCLRRQCSWFPFGLMRCRDRSCL